MQHLGILVHGTSIAIALDAPQPLPVIDRDAEDLPVCQEAHAHYYARRIQPEQLPNGFQLMPLRQLLPQLDSSSFERYARALQLLEWQRTHQFCGCCGSNMHAHPRELAKVCPACGHSAYPRINPCVIVAITRGSHLLLARAQRFQIPMFSLIAGFVEVGETLEQSVHREVAEEVGLQVGKLRYLGSQPWPFASNLMIGFQAEYVSGELCLQDDELAEADFFHPDHLPLIPPQGSIAHQIIEQVCQQLRGQTTANEQR